MTSNEWNEVLIAEYNSLTHGVGWVDVGPRTEMVVTGRDRVRVVNNFCTADIQRLAIGLGTEAFILNVKGMTLGHVGIYVSADQIEISSVPNQAATLVSHMRQYVVSEQVEFEDVSDRSSSILLAGPSSPDSLARLIGPQVPHERMSHVRATMGNAAVAVRRTDLLGIDGFELVVPIESKAAVTNLLSSSGIIECHRDVLETLRIENRIPVYGIDIDAKNLPQEIGRNLQAISFTKGCYLGQETVARLDSLGHVNRHWVALGLNTLQVLKVGTLLDGSGKPLARITSATWSPKYGKPLAMAFVRNGQHLPGQVLATEFGDITVLE